MQKSDVCVIVVTYNRADKLLNCLNAIREQTYEVDYIIVVDNSTNSDTENAIKKEVLEDWDLILSADDKYIIRGSFSLKKKTVSLYYLELSENIGSAGGYYEGIKLAYELNSEWMWLLDDDLVPSIDCLENLMLNLDDKYLCYSCVRVKTDNKTNSYAVIGGYNNICHPWNISPIKDVQLSLSDYVKLTSECKLVNMEIELAPFGGMLLNRKLIDLIGLPMKELFYGHDDIEYCCRILQYTKILQVVNSTVLCEYEPFKSKLKVFKYNEYRRSSERFLLNFYNYRNLIYIKKRECGLLYTLVHTILFLLPRALGAIILFDKRKVKRIMLLIDAILDGLRGKFDNKKPANLYRGCV